jgi:hypothetical protein
METTRVLPVFVGGQRANRDLTGTVALSDRPTGTV